MKHRDGLRRRGCDWVDQDAGAVFRDLRREPGQGRTAKDDDIRAIVRCCLSRKGDQVAFQLRRDVVNGHGRVFGAAHTGKARIKTGLQHAILIPPHHMRRKRDHCKALAQNGCGQNRGLGHAHDRNIKQLARSDESGVSKSGNDDRVYLSLMCCYGLQHVRAGDLRLGA